MCVIDTELRLAARLSGEEAERDHQGDEHKDRK
jgi:hypothetical protein